MITKYYRYNTIYVHKFIRKMITRRRRRRRLCTFLFLSKQKPTLHNEMTPKWGKNGKRRRKIGRPG